MRKLAFRIVGPALFVLAALVSTTSAQGRFTEKIDFGDGTSRTLVYQTGSLDLEGIAELTVPKGFKYLPPKDTKFVLEDLFWNDNGGDTLGMLIPEEILLSWKETSRSYFVVIDWNPNGYVSDKDASTMNYDEILKTLQSEAKERNADSDIVNKADVLGWAEPPHYDPVKKIQYFAKNLQFHSETGSTLNYQMQFLGRKGYVQLNLVSDAKYLQVVKKDFPTLLTSIEFKDGQKYSDFDPATDEVSQYGLAGLLGVAGVAVVAKKAGLALLIVKFWKIIILAVVGGFAKFKNRILSWFGKGNS